MTQINSAGIKGFQQNRTASIGQAGASKGANSSGQSSQAEQKLQKLQEELGQLQQRRGEVSEELSQREAEKLRLDADLVGRENPGFDGSYDSAQKQKAFIDAGNGQNANSQMARRNATLVGDDSIGFSGEADSVKRQNMFTANDAVEGKIAKTGEGGDVNGSTTDDLSAELQSLDEQIAQKQAEITDAQAEMDKEKEEKGNSENSPENKADDLNKKMQAMRVQGQLDTVNNEISIKQSQSSASATKGANRVSSDLIFASPKNKSSQSLDDLNTQKQSLESQLTSIRS